MQRRCASRDRFRLGGLRHGFAASPWSQLRPNAGGLPPEAAGLGPCRLVMTSEADRHLLLSVARRALTAHVTGAPAPEAESNDVLLRPAAAFVTLHCQGELRGCIG